MPELPEVHALATDLGSRLTGRVVDRFDLLSFSALKTFDPPVSSLGSRAIGPITRHGKYLDIAFDHTNGDGDGDGDRLHLLVHLARAGWIRWRDSAPKPSAAPGRGALAARLVLDDGSGFDITEAGTKKSLAIHLVRDAAEVPRVASLGPDPLDAGFTESLFAGILAGAGRSQIKGLLRNQAVIAGIGNAYSDEILHVAKMSPYAPASMSPENTAVLFAAIQSTLKAAIARADGLAASELKREKKSHLRVHGRAGETCPVCGDVVRQVRFADSSLEYCATCQTNGKPLADRVLSRLLK
ncbi:formamidopyrimidine-DNA glycosylase [Salinibacterium xinjiangense]|uniref:Formamidopyrimidine-DNA glycosylase n=1 Tax=Salinibacterium xinjiangense TaxID=386302 RepID=A0A2C8ZWY6_9MICO|nr:DNA-formamidopyrimidine glycosylase family protein [Salinibacterium xinjiangense]GGL01944.1 formamidopyrimidine-DNA glycosylase [Salinibacterium xinjiangense]SOE70307.1 formamidopyrimidine-DNA glycosylase [Salinibacterium xinjiangense]